MGIFTGTTGDDTIFGSSGADTMIGLTGNDAYIVNDPGDQVVENAGEGTDAIFSSISYVLAAGVEVETLSTSDWNSIAALNLTGNEFANWLVGNAGANLLNGGTGADILQGRGGNDLYIVDNVADQVFENAGEGADAVYTSVSYALRAGSEVETLSTLDWNSTAALNLTGNELANWLVGNAGANQLNGGAGADILQGRGGNDAYFVDNAGDFIVEAAGEGADVVYATASYALNAGAEVETLSTQDWNSIAALDLTGNELANYLIGNAGANYLRGGGGNDIVDGKQGNDTLDGGAGADYLVGGIGNDSYIIDNAADAAIEAAGQGTDAAYTTVSYALAAGSEIETLSTLDWNGTAALNLTGNEFANWLIGNAGSNLLDGGAGADILQGRGGNDLYIVDNALDLVLENVGEGADAVYTSVSYTLAAGAEVETLSTLDWNSTAALNLTGNELANSLFGNAGANLLNGGAGNDVLQGQGGADTFAFTTALGGGNNIDTIVDFLPGTDKILLGGNNGEPFAILASGALRAGTVVSLPGAAAQDADDYLIYNKTTGQLFFDADGNGQGAGLLIATLSSGLTLTEGDFIVSGPANTAPTISSGSAASVAENSAASTIVYQSVANDADGDRITYSLTGTDAALLTIDANGAVRLQTPADFETKASYTFNVVASDSGSSTSKSVSLTVTDVADGGSTPIINETSAPNDSIAAAQAVDRNIFAITNNPNLPDNHLPSATIVGNLPTSADSDFFAITLQAGEKLILDVDNSSGNLDTMIRVYGSNGVEIGNNDDPGSLDPGSAPHPTYGHNTDSFFSFRAPTAGTYYFSIESFQDAQNPTFGSYELNVSIGPPATPQQLNAENVDALISGQSWNHTSLTYGFPTSGNQYPISPAPAEVTNGFTPFTAFQQGATSQLIQLVANVASLTFQQVTGAPGNADIRYAMSNEPDVAYAFYPTNGGPTSLGGSAWFNHDNFNTPVRGNYAWMGILHETGHTLGLKHGHEAPAVSADRDSVEYTVMTYRSYPGAPVGPDDGGYTNETWGYPQTLMMYDIAALQKLYGANFGFNANDSVYSWSTTSGEMSINGAPQGAPGNGVGGTANRVFMTLWDGGGTDTYDMSNYNVNLTIDLRPGEWTRLDPIQLARLDHAGAHLARGNVANALLYNDDPRSLIENAIGGSGNDTLYANQAANQLTGGSGSDTFKWAAGSDAGAGAQADTIADFLGGTDKIDLHDVDAIAGTGNNDDFTFIGTSAFHNVAGELRYEVIGGSAHVLADLDGNGVADMEIVVHNVTTLNGVDFVF